MILRCSIRNDFTDDLLSIHISDATSMLDSGVGRTKRSAVPAGVWQLPERRCAWSGLQTKP